MAGGDFSGRAVSSAGDVNGDGYDDLIVGASRADPNGTSSGASYVIFGKAAEAYRTVVELSGLDGADGFKISGAAAVDGAGFSVAAGGDVNGDGIKDLIVGARFADPNGTDSGASYVVFGTNLGFDAELELSSLNGGNGFKISGVAASDYAGHSVASAGDVNGDGIDDVIVGARFADPNGPSSGAAYVVFGKTTGFAANVDLSGLGGGNGFRIVGAASEDWSGFSVDSAGDLNGDGFDDVIVGAQMADPNGSASGASYVVFGKSGGFGADVQLSSLNGSNGFKISGVAANDQSGLFPPPATSTATASMT